MKAVESYIKQKLSERGALHFTLIDPDKSGPREAAKIALEAVEGGTTAILVGGSIGVSESLLDEAVKELKKAVRIPVILFPGNITNISRYADAILFMSLLNSENTYFITGAQALGAPIVRRYGLEAIPLGYIIVGEGGAAGYIGQARSIPIDRGEVAALYALAAEYMGMRFIYLERGSGAREPIPQEMIRLVKKYVDIPLIVGGGIRSGDDAAKVVEAGADIIVTGTVAEEGDVKRKIKEIVSSIGLGVAHRS